VHDYEYRKELVAGKILYSMCVRFPNNALTYRILQAQNRSGIRLSIFGFGCNINGEKRADMLKRIKISKEGKKCFIILTQISEERFSGQV